MIDYAHVINKIFIVDDFLISGYLLYYSKGRMHQLEEGYSEVHHRERGYQNGSPSPGERLPERKFRTMN